MKRGILCTALLLVLLLVCITTLPTEARAETEGYYTYTVSNGEATITDCNTAISGDIAIPSTLGGYPVTSIGDFAFDECSNLKIVYHKGDTGTDILKKAKAPLKISAD